MCTVQLSANDDHLHLDVCDDGTGIPPAATPGVGLASMRDRAAELGGELSIETGPCRDDRARPPAAAAGP